MTFTPAAYELYKQAIYKYYRDHPQLRCVKSYTVFLLIDAPGANAFLYIDIARVYFYSLFHQINLI
jgi:hypothetical protein